MLKPRMYTLNAGLIRQRKGPNELMDIFIPLNFIMAEAHATALPNLLSAPVNTFAYKMWPILGNK